MKKLLSMTMLLTVMFLTFSACSNDDDDVATTYTLSFDVHSNLSSTVRLFEYNDNGDKSRQTFCPSRPSNECVLKNFPMYLP